MKLSTVSTLLNKFKVPLMPVRWSAHTPNLLKVSQYVEQQAHHHKNIAVLQDLCFQDFPLIAGTHFFFIGNSIFHLSLELLTKFWKTILKVA